MTVDVRNSPSRDEIMANWTEGVMYNGHNVFNAIYENDDTMRELAGAVDIGSSTSRNSDVLIDGQEVYLGYVPSEDTFVMGFDMWGDEPYAGVVYFKLNDNGSLNMHSTKPHHWDGLFYNRESGAYQGVHIAHSDVVDIRLD